MLQKFPIVLLLLSVLAACDSTTAPEHVQRAESYFDQTEYRSAVVELKNALQKDAALGPARLLLGRSYEMLGDYAAAFKEYQRALDLGVVAPELTLGLLTCRNRLGDHQEVIGELEGTGALSRELAVVLADAYFAAGNPEKASPLYRQAESLATGNLGLASIAWQQGDLSGAAEFFDKALTLDPEHRESWLRKGEFELSQGQFVEAAASFDRVRTLPGGSIAGRLGLARAYLGDRQLEAAQAEVSSVLQANPGLLIAHYLDALVNYQLQDMDGATAALRQVQRQQPDHPPSLFLMGTVMYRQGQFNQAEDNLQRYLAIDRHNESAAKLLAAVRLKQNDPAGMLAALEPFLAESEDPQLLAMAGNVLLRSGRLNRATELLERAVQLAPDEAAFRNQLALSLMAVGEEDRARLELESAAGVDAGQFQSDYLLALIDIRNRDYQSALKTTGSMIEKNPDSPLGHNLEGAVLLGMGSAAEARLRFEQALRVAPDFLPAASNLARLDERAGDLEAARGRYEAVIRADVSNESARFKLAELMARTGDPDAAEQALMAVLELNPESLPAHLGLTRLYLGQNRVREADVHVQAASRIGSDLPDVLLLSGEVALRQGDLAAVREKTERLQGLIAGKEAPARILLGLGRLQSRSGQVVLSRENLEHVLALSDQPNRDALLELASLDIRTGRLAEAREGLTGLRAAGDDSTALQLLAGDLLQAEGNLEDAAERYAALAGSGVREASVRLAMLKLNAGATDQAEAVLDAWIADHPDDVGVKTLRADALLRGDDKLRAMAQYEELQAADNPIILNNLAWLYMEHGDERALSVAERAYEIAPGNGAIADTLGWVLVRAGQPARAIDYLLRSIQQDPGNATLHYHLAVAYLDADRSAEGRAALEQALEIGGFPELDDARRRLRLLDA